MLFRRGRAENAATRAVRLLTQSGQFFFASKSCPRTLPMGPLYVSGDPRVAVYKRKEVPGDTPRPHPPDLHFQKQEA